MNANEKMTALLRSVFGVVIAVGVCGRAVLAQPTSEKAAAILIYIAVVDAVDGADTEFQLSNASASPVDVSCHYENLTGLCSSSFSSCIFDADCPITEICVPNCIVSGGNFQIRLTPGQPIGWKASAGSSLPCDPTPCGSGSDTNAGFIPPVGNDPFFGILRCVATDEGGLPTDQNVLEGTGTLLQKTNVLAPHLDSLKINATGLRAIPGANDNDNVLEIGGSNAEYESCPAVNAVTHFFEGAVDPTDTGTIIQNYLSVVPCSVDFLTAEPTQLVVHLVTINEFEQRLGTSAPLTCALSARLAQIHPTVFNVGTQGTMTGQTLIRTVGGQAIALLTENHLDFALDVDTDGFASVPAHHRGMPVEGDTITLPPIP